ncbi:cytochrome P450 4F6-like isoform X4 [Mya arenaria]|uniref:cytochrome P450 4F6-like isoform X4 n=1 Tax=Mya arenaria TaxID=6604 RepID=UPI0022E4358A|nr:cytochrome P450 4F6-like isoform X4 [Mya arenaria]
MRLSNFTFTYGGWRRGLKESGLPLATGFLDRSVSSRKIPRNGFFILSRFVTSTRKMELSSSGDFFGSPSSSPARRNLWQGSQKATLLNREVLLAKLKSKAASNDRFDVFQNVLLCTLEIILKCAFSYEKDIQQSGDTNPYVKAVNRITDSLVQRFLYPYMLFDFIFYKTSVGRQFKKDCNFVHSVAEEIIHKRKNALDSGENVALEGKRYVDFLDILLTARDEEGVGLSSLEVRNEVDTFLFEGHDTTASAISWILYSLAEHPEYQKRCQQEVDQVLEGRDSDFVEWSDMPKFEFLTQCIKEGMRLHGPVPIVNREVKEDFEIGGRNIPAGSIVQLNIWALHHKESVWGPDHMEFKPERFSPENVDKMSPFQFVPFSAGPRNCIGQHFAMNEEKSVLAKLLRNFTFRIDTSHVVKKNLSAVMRTVDGMFMYVEERKA